MDDTPRRENAADDDPLDLFASEGGAEDDSLLDAWSENEPAGGIEGLQPQPSPAAHPPSPQATGTASGSFGDRRLLLMAAASILIAATVIVTLLVSGGSTSTVASSARPARPPAETPVSAAERAAPIEADGAEAGAPAPAVAVDRSAGQPAGRDSDQAAATPRAEPPAGRETGDAVGPDAGGSAADARLRETLTLSEALLTQPPASPPQVFSDARAMPAPGPAPAAPPLLPDAPPVLVPSAPPAPARESALLAEASTDADTRPAAANAGTDAALASPPPAPSPVVPAPVPVRSLIHGVLDEYRDALNALDPAAVRAVWPSADVRTLGRAFDQVEEQKFEFDTCTITPIGPTASATCVGTVRYVPKVGNRTMRLEKREWAFKLRQRNEAWFIDGVTTR